MENVKSQDMSKGFFDIDAKNLKFKKTKEKMTEHHKNYVIFTESGKPSIKLENVYLPFGVEQYNKRQLLNIELYPTKNNVHTNLESLLLALETEFTEKKFGFSELKEDIKDLTYHSFIKPNPNKSIHIRTYLSANPDIHTYIGKFKENIMKSSLQGTKCNVELELGTMWLNNTNYGVIWYVKSVQVL